MFIVLSCLLQVSLTLEVTAGSLLGTEYSEAGLTDKQLAIQRWFSHLTFLNKRDKPQGDGWEDYLKYEEYPSQLSNNALRYQLGHLSYAAAFIGYHMTPGYREVTVNILKDAIERMINWKVWDYVKLYWKDRPTYPDPVIYQNIMYSGHLMQMLALYESMSGDMSYSRGFDFVNQSSNVSIHYTAQQLAQVIVDLENDDAIGGVCCEPHGIFILCNNFQRNGFRLYDRIHNTNFSSFNDKWRKTILNEGRLDWWSSNGDRYLKIVQGVYPPLPRVWLPIGAAGNDGWALSYMLPWWSSGDFNVSFVCQGLKFMHGSRMWRVDANGNPYLSDEFIGHKFDFNDEFTTSFYPLVERQCIHAYANLPPKTESVYLHFEKLFGKRDSSGPDGVLDSYFYDTGKDFRIMQTSNLVMSMLVTGVNSLVDLFSEPFFRIHRDEIFLAHVDYPRVMVSYAKLLKFPKSKFVFRVKTNDGNCAFGTKSILENVFPNLMPIVTQNKIPVPAYAITRVGSTLTIEAEVCGTTSEFVVGF